ncbi:MAG: aminotransferase class V-fold PLP-dependent enzyme [Pseudomonadota bacterium]
MAKTLPYGRQSVTEADINAVVDVLRGPFWTTGPKVLAFEEAVAEVTEADHCVSVSNGTAALQILYQAAGLTCGDVIIVPAITFLATANAAEFLGARAVFADVDPQSGLMTPETFAAAIDRYPEARYAVAVHLNGRSCDMQGLAELAHANDVMLFEDAAHALGSQTRADNEVVPVGKNAFSAGSCFSFHPVKTVAMGEGGAITFQDAATAERARLLRSHGMSRDKNTAHELLLDDDGQLEPWCYVMDQPGHNVRVTDIQCALGLSQLARLPETIEIRRCHVQQYNERFADHAELVFPVASEDIDVTTWHLYPILCQAGRAARAALYRALRDQHINPQIHYIPLPLQPYFKGRCDMNQIPGAISYYERCLSLPLYVGLTPEDIDRVADTVIDFLEVFSEP